jgi:hypothetical protein
MHWALLAFVVLGVAFARPRDWVLLAGPILLVTVNAAVYYGSTRLRGAAEPSLAVFAAAGVVWLLTRRKPDPKAASNAVNHAGLAGTGA